MIIQRICVAVVNLTIWRELLRPANTALSDSDGGGGGFNQPGLTEASNGL